MVLRSAMIRSAARGRVPGTVPRTPGSPRPPGTSSGLVFAENRGLPRRSSGRGPRCGWYPTCATSGWRHGAGRLSEAEPPSASSPSQSRTERENTSRGTAPRNRGCGEDEWLLLGWACRGRSNGKAKSRVLRPVASSWLWGLRRLLLGRLGVLPPRLHQFRVPRLVGLLQPGHQFSCPNRCW